MTDYAALGFVRAGAWAPALALADPPANAARIQACLDTPEAAECFLRLFPELCITGFSCEDLFFGDPLLDRAREAVAALARRSGAGATIIGAPYAIPDGRLLNVSFVLHEGAVVGAVPKQVLPTYGEFYDQRWFASGRGVDLEIDDPLLGRFPLSSQLLFDAGALRFGLEICEDLWAPDPVGNRLALAGAELILNPSASNELVGKADYRRQLVTMASASRICGYLYGSAGPMESTKDLVFGGHLLAAENGQVLAEGERFRLGAAHIFADFDIATLRRDRRWNQSFNDALRPRAYRRVALAPPPPCPRLDRSYGPRPFVPDDAGRLQARAAEILAIQATGLARRLAAVGDASLVLGLSGGLDSTWALVVCLETLRRLGRPLTDLHAVTMPGPGTSALTLDLARRLAGSAGVDLRHIDIGPAVRQHLADLEHGGEHDVTFENAQARERTQLLFNLANRFHGIVVGTGDLSELALGWCTFNADQMANYGVNVGVPKTLIRYLVRWYADQRAQPALAGVLREVLEIPVSPELLPGEQGEMAQRTEQLIGPYELHDFFLFHAVRHGWSPEKIAVIAGRTFAGRHEPAEISRWLSVFLTRFHRQQFKRTTLPPGPKVGTVSLSPRGDWRMPDEATPPPWPPGDEPGP